MVKVLCRRDPVKLLSFISRTDINCDIDDCKGELINKSRRHALATLNFKSGDGGRRSDAMDTWVELIKGSVKDETFPGLKFVVEKLRRYKR